jgi:4-diphosphocytidyl-2-C-methyl-D-erythritol kinase
MIGFPHAKINLGLSIISKRPDGFHELETIFYPIPLRDILEFIPAPVTSLISSGLPYEGAAADNLVIRAYELIKERYPRIPPLEIHLYKSIPSGAGLGGGSADAACMLGLLNDYFELNIPENELASYALSLGSDCPFFLQPVPCFARGRGEILEPVHVDLSGYSILLVHPEIHISTARAFSMVKPDGQKPSIKDIVAQPVVRWRDHLINDFEIPVFAEYPGLKKIKDQLYDAGAVYASLTGSGSGLYGIFGKNGIPAAGIDTPARQSFFLYT